jgi:hypothetical protein
MVIYNIISNKYYKQSNYFKEVSIYLIPLIANMRHVLNTCFAFLHSAATLHQAYLVCNTYNWQWDNSKLPLVGTDFLNM